MNKMWLGIVCSVLLLAACGSGEADDAGVETAESGDSSGSGGEGSEGDTSDGGTDDGGAGGDGQPDNEDAAEIIGNEDLDLDELAEIDPDTAEALDEIDDMVSIGDCQSETVGLAMSYVPDGWQCRVLDQPVGDLDGFTLFQPGNPGGLEITIGTPSPFGPICEALQACDQLEPIDLGSTFDMQVFEAVGVPFISGTHKIVPAEAVIVAVGPLSDADSALVTMVLNGVVEL